MAFIGWIVLAVAWLFFTLIDHNRHQITSPRRRLIAPDREVEEINRTEN